MNKIILWSIMNNVDFLHLLECALIIDEKVNSFWICSVYTGKKILCFLFIIEITKNQKSNSSFLLHFGYFMFIGNNTNVIVIMFAQSSNTKRPILFIEISLNTSILCQYLSKIIQFTVAWFIAYSKIQQTIISIRKSNNVYLFKQLFSILRSNWTFTNFFGLYEKL